MTTPRGTFDRPRRVTGGGIECIACDVTAATTATGAWCIGGGKRVWGTNALRRIGVQTGVGRFLGTLCVE